MEGDLSYDEFVQATKEKSIRVVFNPFFEGRWSMPLPQRFYIISGLAWAWVITFVITSAVLGAFLGGEWWIVLFVLSAVMINGITILSGRYISSYALKNREFYEYCIKQGVFYTKQIKQKKVK